MQLSRSRNAVIRTPNASLCMAVVISLLAMGNSACEIAFEPSTSALPTAPEDSLTPDTTPPPQTTGPTCAQSTDLNVLSQDNQERMLNCGINERGQQKQICTSIGWQDEGECQDPDECRDQSRQGQNCGRNLQGQQFRLCENGTWLAYSACEDPDACDNGALEVGNFACGLNAQGQQDALCAQGIWQGVGPCQDPDACSNGTRRALSCGLNERGSRNESCRNGQWAELNTCQDPDQCLDDTTDHIPCGLNGSGTQSAVCVDGRWQNEVNTFCTGNNDVCINGAPEGRSCGLNNNGSQFRHCTQGQWPPWETHAAPCDDIDTCVLEDVGVIPCGNNLSGTQPTECMMIFSGGETFASMQITSNVCSNQDACQNGTIESIRYQNVCGHNMRGDRYGICIEGAWEIASSDNIDDTLPNYAELIACNDTDICEDDTIQSPGSCGKNNRGTADSSTCVAGQWKVDNNSLCNDPDLCVDGSLSMHLCACPNGSSEMFCAKGVQTQACIQGQWEASTDCVAAVGSGQNHTCWQTQGRTVACEDETGEEGTTPQTTVPSGVGAAIEGDVGYPFHLVAGDAFSCITRIDDQITCWGSGAAVSQAPSGTFNRVGLVAGGRHACVLTTAGDLICWGDNEAGQATPPQDLTQIIAIAAGSAHTCAIRIDGSLRCFGANNQGQATPPQILGQVRRLSAGQDSTCAMLQDGGLSCFGALDLEIPGDAATPDQAQAIQNAVQIDNNDQAVCLKQTSGQILCIDGQGNIDAPIQGQPASTMHTFDMGVAQSCGLDAQDLSSLQCW